MQAKVLPTQNKRGFTYKLSKYGNAFLDFARKSKYPVVDIGCAYGVATIPALGTGANVIAVDMDANHLQTIQENVPEKWRKRLTLLQGKFPFELSFAESSIGAFYISHVLPFLTPEETDEAVHKLYKWLVPGGKVFIISFSPFIKLCEGFLPVYYDRRSQNIPNAGLINNLQEYAVDKDFAKNLPSTLNHMDLMDFRRVFERNDFLIETLEYFGDEEAGVPPALRMDNCERIGLVATKEI